MTGAERAEAEYAELWAILSRWKARVQDRLDAEGVPDWWEAEQVEGARKLGLRLPEQPALTLIRGGRDEEGGA